MVITNHEWPLVHPEKEHTLSAICNTYSFCSGDYVNPLAVFDPYSLKEYRNIKGLDVIIISADCKVLKQATVIVTFPTAPRTIVESEHP